MENNETKEKVGRVKLCFAPHSGRGVLGELDLDNVLSMKEESDLRFAVVADGTVGGSPIVLIRMDLAYGKVAIGRTTAAQLCSIAQLILARYPDLLKQVETREEPQR